MAVMNGTPNHRRGAALIIAAVVHGVAAPVYSGSVSAGPHVRMVCDFDDQNAADTARDTAEKAWVEAAGLWGRSAESVDSPRELHLYATIAEYEAAEAQIAQGRFKENLAFTSWDTKAAHVAMQPPLV